MKRSPKTVVKIPAESRILILEDSSERIEWFRDKLLGVPGVVFTYTASQAMKQVSEERAPFDLLFVDHDLGALEAVVGNGSQFCIHMCQLGYAGENVIIHSWNPIGRAKMKDSLPYAHVLPWGSFDIEVI